MSTNTCIVQVTDVHFTVGNRKTKLLMISLLHYLSLSLPQLRNMQKKPFAATTFLLHSLLKAEKIKTVKILAFRANPF